MSKRLSLASASLVFSALALMSGRPGTWQYILWPLRPILVPLNMIFYDLPALLFVVIGLVFAAMAMDANSDSTVRAKNVAKVALAVGVLELGYLAFIYIALFTFFR